MESKAIHHKVEWNCRIVYVFMFLEQTIKKLAFSYLLSQDCPWTLTFYRIYPAFDMNLSQSFSPSYKLRCQQSEMPTGLLLTNRNKENHHAFEKKYF